MYDYRLVSAYMSINSIEGAPALTGTRPPRLPAAHVTAHAAQRGRAADHGPRRHRHLPGLLRRADDHPPPLPRCGTALEGEFGVGRFGGSIASRWPARELPALARQPEGDGARARHQLPHRPRPGRRPRSRLGLRRRPSRRRRLRRRRASTGPTGTQRTPRRRRRPAGARSSSAWRARRSVPRRRPRRSAARCRRLMATYVRTQEIEHDIGARGRFALG